MRKEKDSMGEMEVPDTALYGASTQRAVLNFPISGLRFSPSFVSALGIVKYAAAKANAALGIVPADKADAICKAALEVIEGKLYDQFVVDIFQTGSGTSTNMNANEVITNRALEIIGAAKGARGVIHPNDHVNQCQSSNDVIPTAIHISANEAIERNLLPALTKLASAFDEKAKAFKDVIKCGRTHLQDATPITLGQEMSGYATQIKNGIARVKRSQQTLLELALGGTAVGTGLNTHPEFPSRAIAEINKLTKGVYKEAPNHFEAQGARDAAVEMIGQLKTVACSLMKIANDIRWLSSGPRCAVGEITLPETQPGSSIMPAKVNPVICESVMMVCAHIIGNDAAVTTAAHHGNFELNVMMPVISYNLNQAIELLANTANNFTTRCVEGIDADRERCLSLAEKSLATCTSLAPKIGYDKAAEIAKIAFKKDKTVREVAREMKVLDEAELARVLDLTAMTKPGL